MTPHRVGLYIEVTCPGTDATDAVHRAAHALERVCRAGVPVYPAFASADPIIQDGETVYLDLHSADGLEAAALSGKAMMVPRSRMTQLLRETEELRNRIASAEREHG